MHGSRALTLRAKRSSRRRGIERVFVALVGGMLANYGVAWACVLWSPVQEHWSWSPTADELTWAQQYGDRVFMPADVAEAKAFGCSWKSILLVNEFSDRELLQAVYAWESRSVAVPEYWLFPACVTEVQAGWPFSSLNGEQWVHGLRVSDLTAPRPTGQRLVHRGALSLPAEWSVGRNGVLPNAAPLRLMLPGAILNLVLYTSLVYVGLLGARIARRRLRLQRGRCAECGYPRVEGVPSDRCSECGATWAMT